MSEAHKGRVFSAGGECFTWADVVESARSRGDWATLRQRLLRLLAREEELAAAGALPDHAEIRSAANEFRYRLSLLSSDELREWLDQNDVTVDEWMGEMRRSLLEPASHESADTAADERACWVHAACSGTLSEWAQTLAEEVAVHLGEQSTLSRDDLKSLSEGRLRFCQKHSQDAALTAEIHHNTIEWTRINVQLLIHRDEMVAREAALCVKLDGRPLHEVAQDAGAEFRDECVLIDEAEPTLRTRLLAATPGEIVGPIRIGNDYELVQVVRRVPPRVDDLEVRRRAEQAVVKRALAVEVSRHVTWHEYL